MPFLWLRGILPEGSVNIENKHAPTDKYSFHPELNVPELGAWPSGNYYGDGSGGEYSSYPNVGRCGIGIAYLDFAGNYMFGIYYALPGPNQTVPRSGNTALLTVLEMVSFNAVITFIRIMIIS